MDITAALKTFSSLSQETRLRVFQLLIEYGREGTPAGALSESLDIPHNTLSFHLANLSQAGLVTSQRDGRTIIYKANLKIMESLIGFLNKNCCIREIKKTKKSCTPAKAKKK